MEKAGVPAAVFGELKGSSRLVIVAADVIRLQNGGCYVIACIYLIEPLSNK